MSVSLSLIINSMFPMILCFRTMNFTLHENDFGREIVRLYCFLNFSMSIVRPLSCDSTEKHSLK